MTPGYNELSTNANKSKSKLKISSLKCYKYTHNVLVISIRMEIASENPHDHALLKNAPHTLAMITSDEWEFPYSRQKAAFPLEFVHENKFWPSVRRVDEAYGDRNLVCSCSPIESYINA